MRRLFLLLLLLLAPLMADGIKWYTDVPKAQAAAQKSKKIIFVYVEAAHCPYCEEMLNDTLSDKDVVRNINNDYIALKVDLDTKEGQKYFGATTVTPTSYFYTPNGKVLETLEGLQNVEFFFWGMSKAERLFKEMQGK
jgi:thiol:disulfide interchange protein